MKPILMSTDMVRAILDGRKTVTRRVVKPQPEMRRFGGHEALAWVPPAIVKGWKAVGVQRTEYLKRPYNVGDILYVRETWKVQAAHRFESDVKIMFKAGGPLSTIQFPGGNSQATSRDDYDTFIDKWMQGDGWRPSIHMPREAARIWLRVTDVRVERLQDIGVQDVIREGVLPDKVDRCTFCGYGALHYPECDYERCDNYNGLRYFKPFIDIWNSTVRSTDRERYGWAANPWVWVIAFERCEKPKEAKS